MGSLRKEASYQARVISPKPDRLTNGAYPSTGEGGDDPGFPINPAQEVPGRVL